MNNAPKIGLAPWLAGCLLSAFVCAPTHAAPAADRAPALARDGAYENIATEALREAAESGALFAPADLRAAVHRPLPAPKEPLPAPREMPLDEHDFLEHAARSTLALYCASAKNARSMSGSEAGTAYVIHPSGIALTCLHALRRSEPFAVTVVCADGRVAKVTRILSVLPRHDLVFLQLEGTNWPALPLRRDAPAGIRVFALGHPLGIHFFLVEGLLARYEDIAPWMDARESLPRMNLSLASGSGFSGGPVLDARGNALGMVDSMRVVYKEPERYTVHSAIPAAVIRSFWDGVAPAPMSEAEIEQALDPDRNIKTQTFDKSIIRTERPEGEILTTRTGDDLQVRVVDPSGHILFSGAPSNEFRDRLPEWAQGAYDENMAAVLQMNGAGPEAP